MNSNQPLKIQPNLSYLVSRVIYKSSPKRKKKKKNYPSNVGPKVKSEASNY